MLGVETESTANVREIECILDVLLHGVQTILFKRAASSDPLVQRSARFEAEQTVHDKTRRCERREVLTERMMRV